MPGEPLDGGLVQPDRVVEGPQLTPVGVAGELQVHAGAGCLLDLHRLVGHQHDGDAVVPAVQRRVEVRPVADALPLEPGTAPRTADLIVINAYMSAYTAALLAWADGNGERKLEELMDEAFDALDGR